MRVLRLLVAVLLLAGPAFAVQPDEMLSDPGLEARARHISQGLRCTQCRNENIDESNAGIARDLRLLVRERLLAGDSNAEVIDYVVDRYGEFVLLQPTVTGMNWVLWLAGPVMLLAAGGIAFAYVRRRDSSRDLPEPLTEAEAEKVRRILGE